MANTLDEVLLREKAFGLGTHRTMLDPRYGAQNGYANDFPSYVNHTPYASNNLIIKLLAAPAGFKYLPNGDIYVQAIKTLFEKAASKIDGFTSKLEPEFQGTPFGNAGEEQDVITGMKRARTNITLEIVDRVGRPYTELFNTWQLMFGKHPETKHPLACTLTNPPPHYLPNMTSAILLAYEPNEALNGIEKAWISYGVFPKDGVEVAGRMDKQSAGELLSISMSFTSITQQGIEVNKLAQKYLDAMNFAGTNPNLRPPAMSGATADVDNAKTGFQDLVDTIRSTNGTF